MNRLLCLVVLLTMSACATRPPTPAPAVNAPTVKAPTNARITGVNEQFRFVVIDFGTQAMPAVGTTLPVYRGDQRVGSVRITEPRPNRQATADIVDGNARVNDEVR